jgi:GTPase SAR1 family protein
MSWPSLAGIPLLLLGNKNDLEGSLTEEELISQLNLQLIQGRPIACYSVSAKNQTNIDTVVKYLTNVKNVSN